MSGKLTVEAVVESAQAAIAAQEGGVERVELCANLLEGGTTPSAGTIRLVRERIDIGLNVMIRPRGGDFCYSSAEFEVIEYDIEFAKNMAADGVVFGILNSDGTVDRDRTAALVELSRPLSVTFHRAFDMSRDPYEALETLVELGVDRILTSGQEHSVLEGLDLITDLVQKAGERIIIMPGAGITERNIHKIVTQSGAQEIHIYAPVTMESPMKYRHTGCFMGGELRPPEFARAVTDPCRIQAFLGAVRET